MVNDYQDNIKKMMETERNGACPFLNTYDCTLGYGPRIACCPPRMERMGVKKESPEEPTDWHKCIFYILNNKGEFK